MQRVALRVLWPLRSHQGTRQQSSTAVNLLGTPLPELTQLVHDGAGLPAFRAEQIFHEVHKQGNTQLGGMQSLSKKVVAKLEASNLTVQGAEPIVEQRSVDGTRKWLLRLPPSKKGAQDEVETVWIPSKGSRTLCVSSQVGCTLACTFCHTGTQALQRNLSSSDIVAQVLASQAALRSEATSAPAALEALSQAAHVSHKAFLARPVGNVVFMGQGEPLYNWRAVKGAISLLTHPQGYGMSRRRVTISTSGLAPIIPRIAAETGASLAISLHSAIDEVRSRIMGVNDKWPLAQLKEAIKEYITIQRSAPAEKDDRTRVSRDARVTLEYTLLQGINDDAVAARALSDFCHNLGTQWVHVNLIPFNPWDGAPYTSTGKKGMARFQRTLQDSGVFATVRQPRGRDIMAACGQLQSITNHSHLDKVKA